MSRFVGAHTATGGGGEEGANAHEHDPAWWNKDHPLDLFPKNYDEARHGPKWNRAEVLVCPRCGTQETCRAGAELSTSNGLVAIMCPRCDTHYAGQQVGDLRQTYIAFRVDEGQGARWASFCDLMTREGRADGLHPVPHNPRSLDRATLDVLTRIVAHADRAGFHSSCLRARAKILWIGGKAAGFYTYQYPGDFAVDAPWKMNIEGYQVERAVPSLNHIYILRGYRRQGHARRMVEDFFRVPGDASRSGSTYILREHTFAIEAPVAPNMEKLLLKHLSAAEKENLYTYSHGQLVKDPFLLHSKLKVQTPEERVRETEAVRKAAELKAHKAAELKAKRKQIKDELIAAAIKEALGPGRTLAEFLSGRR
jgi:hypothetical protein